MTSAPPTVRSVAVPTEHGGWSLTLEPAVLGLLVAFSGAGIALSLAALVAFVARTPLKLALVDRWRGRELPRTALARRVFVAEAGLGALLLAIGWLAAARPIWWPLAAAAPLVALELWNDMKSRSRHLVPELAGTVGMGATAAVVALAGGASNSTALGLWVVMAARGLAAVPFVRLQLLRLKERAHNMVTSDGAQVAALLAAGVGWLRGFVPWGAVVAIGGLALFHLVAARRPVPQAPVIGAQQVVLGLTVVLVTALSVIAP